MSRGEARVLARAIMAQIEAAMPAEVRIARELARVSPALASAISKGRREFESEADARYPNEFEAAVREFLSHDPRSLREARDAALRWKTVATAFYRALPRSRAHAAVRLATFPPCEHCGGKQLTIRHDGTAQYCCVHTKAEYEPARGEAMQ